MKFRFLCLSGILILASFLFTTRYVSYAVQSTPPPKTAKQNIQFASAQDAAKLNPRLIWERGRSEASSYDLTMRSGALTLIVGPETDLNPNNFTAPRLSLPVSGDFSMRVKIEVDFKNKNGYQGVGIGIRSANNPLEYIRFFIDSSRDGRFLKLFATHNRRETTLEQTKFDDATVFLMIERHDGLFNFSYSLEGVEYNVFARDSVFDLPNELQFMLTGWSTSAEGMIARFQNLVLGPPTEDALATLPDNAPSTDAAAIPFTTPALKGALEPAWQWYPGVSSASRYTLGTQGGTLTLVAGPAPNRTGTAVCTTTSGNFDAQVKLSSFPKRNQQGAGIWLSSSDVPVIGGTERGDFISIERFFGNNEKDAVISASRIRDRNRNFKVAKYNSDKTTLRVERRGQLFTLRYSSDGTTFTTLSDQAITAFTGKINICLGAYSYSDTAGLIASFEEFLLRPVGVAAPVSSTAPTGVVSLPFNLPNSPVLSPTWKFDGSPALTSYDLTIDPQALTLIAGPRGEDLGATVCTRFTGDVDVSVLVSGKSTTDGDGAGLALLERGNPQRYFMIFHSFRNGKRTLGYGERYNRDRYDFDQITPYEPEKVYLRLKRVGQLISVYYGSDGATWQTFREGWVTSVPPEMDLCVSAYSYSDNGFIARFQDVKLSVPPKIVAAIPPPEANQIPFVRANNAAALNPALRIARNDSSSAYDVTSEPGTLYLLAAPGVETSISACYTVNGDFDASVQVDSDPGQRVQYSRLLIQSRRNTNAYVSLYKELSDDQRNIGLYTRVEAGERRLERLPFKEKTNWFRIVRKGGLYNFYYGLDGTIWEAVRENLVLALPREADICMGSGHYNTQDGFLTRFRNFKVEMLPVTATVPPTNPNTPDVVPFTDADGTLNPVWRWLPNSPTSFYSLALKPGALAVAIDGEGVTGMCTAITGNFEAQVKLIGSPGNNQQQAAGIWLGAANSGEIAADRAIRLSLERYYRDKENLVLSAGLTSNNAQIPVESKAYSFGTVYLKIERTAQLFTLSFGQDGETWTPIREQFVSTLPTSLDLCLAGYTTDRITGIYALFEDFQLIQR